MYRLHKLATTALSVMVCAQLELLGTDERKFQPESLKYALFSRKVCILYCMINLGKS